MLTKIKIESNLNNLYIVEKAIDNITKEAGVSKEFYGKIMVSAMEAVNNAIVHGNRSDITKYVIVEIGLENKVMIIKVTDEGKGFTPEKVPDPTKPENIETINGRGVFLMKKLADEIEFNKKGNSVTMKFKI